MLPHEIPWYDWVYEWFKNILVAVIPWYDWVYYPMVRDALGRGRACLGLYLYI